MKIIKVDYIINPNQKLKITFKYILFFILSFCTTYSQAQKINPTPPTSRILFVFDASQSMYGTWESGKKINIARNYLIQIIDSLEQMDNIQLALRVYGHQSPVPPQDCSDTKLEVPFSPGNEGQIRQKLRYLIPKGTTPIANSLELAANDFPPCDNCRNIIILITDGIEACDGDPCQASLNLQKKGIILKPFVIGIGIDPNFEKTFECVGHFYNTPNEEKFQEVLGVVISRALNSTTAQVNLLDIHGTPSETNVNMTFFDHISGRVKYNFVHTINYMGNPDTLIIDPLIEYDVVVHTLPAVKKEEIILTEGKHNMIGLHTPQGSLHITCPGSNQYKDLDIIIRQSANHQTLNIQNNNTKVKYLVGEYDLEILSIPRVYVNNVKIDQSTTTNIAIPRPGIANFSIASSGFGSIYVETADTLKWIYNLDERKLHQNIIMQPGNYRVVYRPKNIKQSIYTINKKFTIKSGSSKKIILY
ncbi:MAG: VWA domain-containing protein [Bacteroidales bacterium]|jgi:Ca-activated chloride channel family protein|nr:VWA domain-containing protein [Bacteroidales bacterium]